MSDETKCKSCGQELPHHLQPIQKLGIVKWIRADREQVAFEVDGALIRAWAHGCPTMKEVQLSEGDRVELLVIPDKYTPTVVRVALPAQALVEAEPV